MAQFTDAAGAKRALRRSVSAARARLSPQELLQARLEVCAAVIDRCRADEADGRPWRQVFAYEPLPDEPGSNSLLEVLHARGCVAHVPVLRVDNDLDWTDWSTGQVRGIDAPASADAVIVPALAVDRRGVRLGRGGGSYDRVLLRVPANAVVVALLHRGEWIEEVPAQPWDRPVAAIASPDGWVDLHPS